MPNRKSEEQVPATDEQFLAIAQILATGLLRFFRERRTLEARSETTSTPEHAEVANRSAVPRKAKTVTPRPRPRPSVEELIETKASEIRHQCGLPTTDLDDLRQSIHLDLLKRQHLFDPQRASWEWFAKVVINSWAAMFLRDRKRLKRLGEQRTVSLHDPCADHLGIGHQLSQTCRRQPLAWAVPAPPDDPFVRIDRREAIDLAMRTLPEQYRKVVHAVSHNGRAATARKFGVSRRLIGNILAKARRHFEVAGLESCDLS